MEQTKSQTDAPPPPLRRRNSIATTFPSKLSIPTTTNHPPRTSLSFPNGTTVSPKSLSTSFGSYTSLKDILAPTSSTINSPTGAATAAAAAAAAKSSYEISIRNRLVKQAAWAYLQPKSSPVGSAGTNILCRVWLRFCDCLGFIKCHVIPSITRVFSQVLRSFMIVRETR